MKHDSRLTWSLCLEHHFQVAPVCALPNMALKGCTRVPVNRCINDCLQNYFPRTEPRWSEYGLAHNSGTTRIGSRKHVSLRPIVEADCDDFVRHFFHTVRPWPGRMVNLLVISKVIHGARAPVL